MFRHILAVALAGLFAAPVFAADMPEPEGNSFKRCGSTVEVRSEPSAGNQYTYFWIVNRSSRTVAVKFERSLMVGGRREPDPKPLVVSVPQRSEKAVPGIFPTKQSPKVKLLGCRF
tara:strand:+ start:4167 stop:4514 length:348 start_codon:yes stop_codon:yes gene_type:complete